MEAIYRAEDGTPFLTAEEATAHDRGLHSIALSLSEADQVVVALRRVVYGHAPTHWEANGARELADMIDTRVKEKRSAT